jgi:hypothetical protein
MLRPILLFIVLSLVAAGSVTAQEEPSFVVESTNVTYCASPGPYPFDQGSYHFEVTFNVAPTNEQTGSYYLFAFDYKLWFSEADRAADGTPYIHVWSTWGNFPECHEGMAGVSPKNTGSTRDYCISRSLEGRTLEWTVPKSQVYYGYSTIPHFYYGVGKVYYELRTYTSGLSNWQPLSGMWWIEGESSSVCGVPVQETTWGAVKQMYEE